MIMAIRWRKDGTLVCAIMSDVEEGDTYIDDRLSGKLTEELQVVVADPNHRANGLWYWTRDALIVASPLWKGLGSKSPKSEFMNKGEDNEKI